MTARGWWCLFCIVVMLLAGVVAASDLHRTSLVVVGLTLLLWFGWEWLGFAVRVRTLHRRLVVEREVLDERGPVSTLWAGRFFNVRVTLRLTEGSRLPYVSIADPVPFAMQHDSGATSTDGELTRKAPLRLEYTVLCPLTGVARFEGLRVEITDLQGFFAHVAFVRAPVVLRILPAALVYKGGGPTVKRHNELPPPGIHRLRQPGSGGELLDLRDYLPGDPPRTIAWKVSARRDRLITKELESEVPVRCTLFLDTSSSVRVPSPASLPARSPEGRAGPAYFKPLDRLVELAAGVIRAGASIRDLTGLCLFDDQSSRIVRPERTVNQRNRLLRLLGEAAALAPVAERADPEALLPVAYALAQEVYPDLLRREVNAVPEWLVWAVAWPRYTRHRRGWIDALYRRKGAVWLWCTALVPFSLFVVNLAALLAGAVPDWARTALGALLLVGSPLLATAGWLVLLLATLVTGKQRKHARWRKRLAALLAERYGPVPGGIEVSIQDDDIFSLQLQQFLGEHQVPCFVPLYDDQGRYLFARPEKVGVLARALLDAAARGRDNELYVILADLLELDGHLDPLLQAVRVALGRHHQVIVVCPWPQGVPMPEDDTPTRQPHLDRLHALRTSLARKQLLTNLAFARLHAAYARIRRTFARMAVQVVCAQSEESVPLILNRLERIRSMGGRR
jgi:uncharacterized protein (DUF58 family)